MAGSFFDTNTTSLGNNTNNTGYDPGTYSGGGGFFDSAFAGQFGNHWNETTDFKQNDAQSMNNMKINDSTLTAMHAAARGRRTLSYYVTDIKQYLKNNDKQGLERYLASLVQILNDNYHEKDKENTGPHALILGLNERPPQDKGKYYPSSPTHDDTINGYWVTIDDRFDNTDEAKAINYITRGGTNELVSFFRRSKIKRAGKGAIQDQKNLLDNVGIDEKTLQDTIRYNQSIMTGQHSKAEQYDSLGKAMAQLEVLKDQGSDYADKYEQAINSQLNALRKTDPYVDYYTKVFMSDYYLQYTSNYKQWMKENNPEIAAKINKAEQLKNDRSVHFAMLRLRTKSRRDMDNSRDINAIREMAYGSQEA